jgi:hypothetical protein
MNKDKDHLSKLKPLVNNPQQWNDFKEYLNFIIAQQHRAIEQSDNVVAIHRAQGAIYQLRRLQLLRDEILKNG